MDFKTERLTAERLAPGHLADLTALHLDPEVSRFLGGVRNAAQTQAYLDVNLAHWDQHGYGLWVFRTADGAFVGRAGLRYVEVEGVREMEIAYALRREFWRRGFASEIAQTLTAMWRERRLSASLIGIASPGNIGSCRVLEKASLDREREAVHHGEPVVVYRMALGPP
jgi:RimJ/RimL family protein N-acetyltransferase